MNNISGDRIREMLKNKGMTQRELAEKAGITEASISRYINDKRIPKITFVRKIADALGTTIDYLIEGSNT